MAPRNRSRQQDETNCLGSCREQWYQACRVWRYGTAQAAVAEESALPAGVAGGEILFALSDSQSSGDSEGEPELSSGGEEEGEEESGEEEGEEEERRDEVVRRLVQAVRSGRISKQPERFGC